MTEISNDAVRTEVVDELIGSQRKAQIMLGDTDILDELRSEYMSNLETYGRLSQMRQSNRLDSDDVSQDQAEQQLIVAILAAQSSIRTTSNYWDGLLDKFASGELSPGQVLQRSRDGKLKHEKFKHVLGNSYEIVRKAAECLRENNTAEARRYLIGRKTNDTDDTYLRATKANFACWLLGYETICVDHRIHSLMATETENGSTIAECVFNWPFTIDRGSWTKTCDAFRRTTLVHQKSTRVDQKKHTPNEVEFWHDVLKWNPEVYDALAGHFVDVVAESTMIPADRVSQVVFSTQGDNEIIHTALEILADRS